MNQAMKNKRRSRAEREEENTYGSFESGSTQHTHSHSGSSQQNSNMRLYEQPWDYQRVKEVVGAVFTLATLFLTMKQIKRLEKVNKDVSSILGVRSLGEWVPPQPLLNIIGLEAGGQYGKAA